jgi:hypothetical protein
MTDYYVEAICVPSPNSGHRVWRYSFCRTHADEHIAWSRKCGDMGFWHLFHSAREFCQVCESLSLHPDREPIPLSQVPLHTDSPHVARDDEMLPPGWRDDVDEGRVPPIDAHYHGEHVATLRQASWRRRE